MAKGKFIRRESAKDKEFHFQNWIGSRLAETKFHYELGGRNSYPDFRLVSFTEGYEVKGLAYPGRVVNYDSNSQVPRVPPKNVEDCPAIVTTRGT